MNKFGIKPLVEDFKMPTRATEGATCFDCYLQTDVVVVEPGSWELIPLDFSLDLPLGWEVQLRPRSGLAAKNGVTVLNSPGSIDSDYKGHIKAILINHSQERVVFEPGDRICQMAFAEVPKVELVLTDELSNSKRGEGGFGSTGR